MSLEQFMNDAISPWMREEGPESDIVLSTRIRLARNLKDKIFPVIADDEELRQVLEFVHDRFNQQNFREYKALELITMGELSDIEKGMLVEKHLISPYLIKSRESGVLLSENEQVSVMVNEEDHIRMQLYFPGFQLETALKEAFLFDDWLEEEVNFAFDEKKGYLTSCPTNVGTGLRASVMMHLPALVLTKRVNRMIPAINQLGFVVRGIYGEGSEASGSVFQISNQITLGKSEADIVADLESVIEKLIEQERSARTRLMERSNVQLENQIFRSYGILQHARIMESAEAATRISNVRLGIDIGMIEQLEKTILNELMVLTQPGFLQSYAETSLNANERDVLRASLIRERLRLDEV